VRQTEEGVQAESDGWFVVNLDGARAMRVPPFGMAATFEPDGARFPHLGINVHVLQPGEPNAMYHSETAQESFLVLAGECVLVVEEQERMLRAWDFVHCPPGTPHVIVGAGEGPCAVLMAGGRDPEHTVHYPVSEVAAKHGASVPEATSDGLKAYERAGERDFLPLPWPPQSGA
jgi:uncharacterized cupin superfamily protein